MLCGCAGALKESKIRLLDQVMIRSNSEMLPLPLETYVLLLSKLGFVTLEYGLVLTGAPLVYSQINGQHGGAFLCLVVTASRLYGIAATT
jgi:hypothetical protein